MLLLTSAFACFTATALAGSSGARFKDHLLDMQERHTWQHADRVHYNYMAERNAGLEKRASPYLTDATRPFAVNGSAIPQTDFDIGESYAGLLPISSDANETSKLFFWFFPSANPDATDEIAIWFNGGPGCSSLSGLLTENGPFTWEAGTLGPILNPYSWSNLTNMVWIEQPVGVGYSVGTPTITNEVDLSNQFNGFWRNFVDTFALKGKKMYITGESYGGFYVPYVANGFLEANDTDYFNLAGIAVNDPIIGDETLQQAVPIVPFIDYWANLFSLNQSFVTEIHNASDVCNYTSYFNTYLQFPPPSGPFPVLPDIYSNPGCDVLDSVYSAVLERNPCFNIYHITDTCPFKYSVLGIVNPGDYNPKGSEIYFNRTDVKEALHAPLDSNWLQCSAINVFGGPSNNENLTDTSLGPAQNDVLKNVIEATNNVLIGVGDLDFLLPANGTLLALQNVTWGGVQGFTAPPTEDFYVPYHPEYEQGAMADAGIAGKWITQRGLTFYTVQLAGHELPGYTAGAGYRVLEKLLGRVQTLGMVSDFSTQNGNYTGTSDLY